MSLELKDVSKMSELILSYRLKKSSLMIYIYLQKQLLDSKENRFRITCRELAHLVGSNKSSVSKAMIELQKYKILEEIPSTGSSRFYRLNPVSEWETSRTENELIETKDSILRED